ncbi:MAG: CocE/NonD family hydrolase [Spirochaetes bacterium]|nr:CocE/NonD family hydrolase [Spirochaetota bacterium]MBU1081435.1 CocE/NonD family hydrolase [Spirochaetota bacterium]
MSIDETLSSSGLSRIPQYWDRRYVKNIDKLSKPLYGVKAERDVWMTLRDGTRICADVFRPDADGDFPALLSWSPYGKAIQSMKRGPQPPESLVFDHSLEAGDIDFFVSRGYVFVIPDPRGIGQSEGEFYGIYNPQEHEDAYDVIEWMAVQDWCDGKVGMVGYSYFGIVQMLVAAQQPPSLKCIMPLSFTDEYYQHGYYGGVGNTYMSMYWELCPANAPVPWSMKMYSKEEVRRRMAERAKDPDMAVNSYFQKILTTWPPTYHSFYLDYLLHPEEGPFWAQRSARHMLDKVKVPVFLNSAWSPNGRWVTPLLRAFNSDKLAVPKRVNVEDYGELELPYRSMNEECLRWYDLWLKGVDTGMMEEPPIKLNILGSGYRYEREWPLARTSWKKLYLRSFGRLRWEPDAEADITPDAFVHNPPNISSEVQSLTYTSEPLTRPMEFTGPIGLHLFASIDAADANFVVKVHELYPNGERHYMPCFGALKASHPIVPEESTPWLPVHDHSKSVPVKPGEVREYHIEINPSGKVFMPGHRIQLEIKAMDPNMSHKSSWTGKVASMGPIPSAASICYRVYRDAKRQSHLVMPYIPGTPPENWVQSFD